ncbi:MULTISPECIES: cation-translocating P-type ATPase [Thalassobaculum]|uniref:ATPase, P-type (Transporting), HAD superfamily, subfamily IC n=1 Tax=Thalassobaculum litoreum DSM 18839 TaxID=1123362 RepID=A0A8G2BJH2_9PROT|nr:MULTISPECIES: HAD-IC family P-type ATPase [Thalassobaculum]SDF63042.1 ATPase, P-type (transporting), HAD superfamily, subfamily IC [Thalassobaculum litoreum DSM 18839]
MAFPTGLTQEEAENRLRQYGPNRLPEPKAPGLAVLFIRQFLSPFIYILMIAAAVSFAIGQVPSGAFIVAVLLINALIGTVQEHAAQKSASALRKMVRGSARVIRDGRPHTIDSEAVVPGDLLLLASGDKVPSDVKLRDAQNLAVDESMLTGESVAVSKSVAVAVPADAPLAERRDTCFAGTVVTHGRAEGEVIATGLATELGSIAGEVSARRVSEPPLMIRVRRFTYQVAAGIAVAIAALVALMLAVGGYSTSEMALMAIGLAVSTIPEGLPAALTVALAIGMDRMARHNVIIRKLIAVEALGSCTFICSDKTGTLTVNEMTASRIVLPDGISFAVTGAGIGPGTVEEHDTGNGASVPVGPHLDRLRALCTTGTLANESHLDYAGRETWDFDGDIVDVAFLVLAKKLGLSISGLHAEQDRVELVPYESERALSGSLTRWSERHFLHVKGSPEKLLAMSTHMQTAAGRVPIDHAAVTAQFEGLASDGYRVIALARRELPERGPALRAMEEMTLLGMVAMIDPIRPEAREAVDRCRAGGIEVAMITGDHPATAHAIARDLDIAGPDDPVVTGSDLKAAEAKGLEHIDALVRDARVFARIEPLQKQQIVESLMRAGHFVAVTGDGVNDAPAMHRANVGIAMGKRGTDVAKEAADLIITDDKFSSIVDGVEQGRVVYNNIRKVVGLLIATGFSAILLFFLCVLTGLPMPLTAVQLLWLNLVANGLQDVALAFEPKEGGELSKRPRRPGEPIFERRIVEHVLIIGGAMGVLAYATFEALLAMGYDLDMARNLTLMLMVLFGNIHALCSRSETRSIFRIPLLANPFLMLAVPIAQLVHIGSMYVPGLSDVLAIQPIGWHEWASMLAVALVLLALEEAHKAWHRRTG